MSRALSVRVLLSCVLALGAGIALAWIDTRPGWDDTGVMAGMLVIATALGSFAGVPVWLAPILTGGPMVAAEISRGSGVLLALVFAVLGAVAGALARGAIGMRTPDRNR